MTTMDEFRAMKEKARKAQSKGNSNLKRASLVGILGTALGAASSPRGAQLAGQGANQMVGNVQQANDFEQQKLEQEFMMEMQAKNQDMKFKEMDQMMKMRDLEMKDRELKRKAAMETANFMIGEIKAGDEKRTQAKTDEATTTHQQFMDILDRGSAMAGEIPVLGGSLKKVGEYIEGKVGAEVDKIGAGIEEEVGKETAGKVSLLEAAGQAGPQAVASAGADVGYKTPEQQEADERDTTEFAQRTKINDQIIADNERKASQGDASGAAFMDLVQNGNFTQQYSPDAMAGATQDYQKYRANEKSMRLMGQRMSGAGQPKTTTDVANNYITRLLKGDKIGITEKTQIRNDGAMSAINSPVNFAYDLGEYYTEALESLPNKEDARNFIERNYLEGVFASVQEQLTVDPKNLKSMVDDLANTYQEGGQYDTALRAQAMTELEAQNFIKKNKRGMYQYPDPTSELYYSDRDEFWNKLEITTGEGITQQPIEEAQEDDADGQEVFDSDLDNFASRLIKAPSWFVQSDMNKVLKGDVSRIDFYRARFGKDLDKLAEASGMDERELVKLIFQKYKEQRPIKNKTLKWLSEH